ncbi:MAG: hypothetical protein DMG11_32815 [Acidobacteria bacterium]|nr:MAG: hypothetical protein DMG11_32815 [Acidobacteriota bacterium]
MTISVRNIHRCLLWLVVIILGGIAISVPPLLAQSLYGSIVGTVLDSSGAILPGISVTVVNLGTNGQQRVDTDEYGAYRFVNLIPGLVWSSKRRVSSTLYGPTLGLLCKPRSGSTLSCK